MEQWKEVSNTNGKYSVSNYGSVRNNQTGDLIPQYGNGVGYKKVGLWVDGATRKKYVHRLVAEAFIPNPNGYPEVNHKDGIRSHNHIDNLEWVTSSGNTLDAMDVRKTLIPWGNAPKAIMAIHEATGEITFYKSISEAERALDSRHIVDVLKGRRQHVKGYSFRYVEGGDA